MPRDKGSSQDLGGYASRNPPAGSSTPISPGFQRDVSQKEYLTESDPPASSEASATEEIEALSPISTLAKQCREKFKGLCSVLHSSKRDKAEQIGFDLDSTLLTIDDAQARFKAWGSNIAAFHNGTLRISLDYRLAEAPGMKRRTLLVLEDLQEYLNEATLIMSGEKVNQTWSLNDTSDSSDHSEEEEDEGGEAEEERKDTSGDEEVGSDLAELLKAITASNASLMKLSMVIRSSATRDDYLKAAARYKDWNTYPDIGHVREKHGSAKYKTDCLLDRLGKAIAKRRQFLRYRIEHNDKLAGVWDEDEEVRKKPEKTIASTKATTFIGENVLQNVRAAGSDTGNSFGSQTSYEATIYEGDGAPRKLTVPPPPKFAFPDIQFQYGEPFKCPYCFTEQIVKNKGAWKKHVFRDLKPYVCTFRECEMLMFRSRNEWFAHELRNHRREWVCQLCQHPGFTTVSAFSKHTKSIHPAALASSSLEALVLQSEEPVDKISSTACPLCNEWEADLERKQTNPEAILPPLEDSEKIIPYGKPRLFRRHLGRHMEQLALFALPVDDTEELEDESTDDEREEIALPRHQNVEVEDESSDEGGEDEVEQLLESTYEASEPRVVDTDLLATAINSPAATAPDNPDRRRNSWMDGASELSDPSDYNTGSSNNQPTVSASNPNDTMDLKVLRGADTMAANYGDNMYGYTNPRDLVQFDLNNPPRHSALRDSFEGGGDLGPRAYDNRERGPPPSTRGFDRIPPRAAPWDQPAQVRMRAVSPPPPRDDRPSDERPRELRGERERYSDSDRRERGRDRRHREEASIAAPFNPKDTMDLKAINEYRQVRIVSPPREKAEEKPVKGILRAPREMFPEDPSPIREGVAPLKDAKKDGVPPEARWTKISRKLVNPEALDAGKERFEARDDFVIVLRVLSRDEVEGYAEVTKRIRDAREELDRQVPGVGSNLREIANAPGYKRDPPPPRHERYL